MTVTSIKTQPTIDKKLQNCRVLYCTPYCTYRRSFCRLLRVCLECSARCERIAINRLAWHVAIAISCDCYFICGNLKEREHRTTVRFSLAQKILTCRIPHRAPATVASGSSSVGPERKMHRRRILTTTQLVLVLYFESKRIPSDCH